MELNATTFVLELINFLVLVWILKRFVYVPVRSLVQQRQQQIEESLRHAEQVQQEARDLDAQYRERLTTWESERNAAQASLRAELQTERMRLLEELDSALAQEREKRNILFEREREAVLRELELRALGGAATFATRLLERLAGPELEARLVDMLIEDLASVPASVRASLSEPAGDGSVQARVSSAFALDAANRERLASALSAFAGVPLNCDYTENPELGAGLRVDIGPVVLRANLRDELALFVDAAHDGG